jgi:hypothetical protein
MELVYSGTLEASVLVWDQLPALDPETVYELWYVGDDARPAGLLRPGSDSGSLLLEGEWSAGERVGITIEPAAGSEHPTAEPIAMLGPLA